MCSHTVTVVISGRDLASAWLASYAGGSPGSGSLRWACKRRRMRAPQGLSRFIHGYQQQNKTPSGKPRIMPMKKPLTIRCPSLPSLNMWFSTLCAPLVFAAAAELSMLNCRKPCLACPNFPVATVCLYLLVALLETKTQIWPVSRLAEHWRSLLAESRPDGKADVVSLSAACYIHEGGTFFVAERLLWSLDTDFSVRSALVCLCRGYIATTFAVKS